MTLPLFSVMLACAPVVSANAGVVVVVTIIATTATSTAANVIDFLNPAPSARPGTCGCTEFLGKCERIVSS